MNLATWIAEYMSYLQSDGHAGRTIVSRFKHLNCLQRFCEARGLARLEDFTSKLTEDFIDYWMQHQPWAKPSAGFKGKPTFRPRHHIAVQYSLHGFFHWAYTTGRLKLDVFAFRAPVRGNYFFPEVEEYLCFCTEHKGLAENSLIQIELFVRRFDHFLRDRQVRSWSELGVDYIDVFVRQQAARNVKRVQRVHKILRGLFRYLFSLGRVDRDWASALVSPRQYRLARTPRALMAEQVLDLLRSMDRARWGGKRDFAMILTAASLGVRASEIAELKLQDLDWTRAVVSFPPTKGKNVLRLPLSRPLMEALVDYLKNERPNGRSHRNVFLGLTPPFGPLRWSSVSAAIARRMGSAGIKGSGHQLRHAFASELLRGGVAFSTLQELLGHSHLSSTQIYTKIDVTQLREVAVNDAEDM